MAVIAVEEKFTKGCYNEHMGRKQKWDQEHTSNSYFGPHMWKGKASLKCAHLSVSSVARTNARLKRNHTQKKSSIWEEPVDSEWTERRVSILNTQHNEFVKLIATGCGDRKF